MATYKVVETEQLETQLTDIADAIRAKTGETEALTLPAMAQKIRQLETWLINTAAGNPISLTDSLEMKLRDLRLFGKTTQNGTPTPDAPVELVSAGDGGSIGVTVAGKNLSPSFIPKELNGITITLNSDGSMTLNGTCTNGCAFTSNEFAIPIDTYTLSGNVMLPEGVYISFSNNAGLMIRSGRVTSTGENETETGYMYMWIDSGVVLDNLTLEIQMEKGNIATDYEPYQDPQTLTLSTPNGLPGIPVTSGGNYTDKAGQQWVCDEVNFGRGVHVQRIYQYVFTGNETIKGYDSTKSYGSRFDNLGLPFIKVITQDSSDNISNALCNVASIGSQGTTNGGSSGIGFSSWGGIPVVYFSAAIFGDGATLKSAMKTAYDSGNPFTMIYELATPIETALSDEELAAYAALHTNYPNTTLLNDSGAGMEVRYVADTKTYIDNQVAALSAAIIST